MLWFAVPMVIAAYLGATTMHDHLRNSDQLVSEQSCRKRGLDRLERELDRIKERMKDFEDPPPKGFAGLQLPKDHEPAR